MSIFTGHCSFQPCHHHHKVTDPFPSAAASRSNTGPQQPRQEAITYHRIQTDGQPDSTIRPTSYAAAAKLRPSPAPQLGNAPSIPLHRGNTHLSPDKWRQEGTQLFIYNDAQLMMKLLHVTVWLRMFTITAVQKTLGQGWRNRPLCLRPPQPELAAQGSPRLTAPITLAAGVREIMPQMLAHSSRGNGASLDNASHSSWDAQSAFLCSVFPW